VRISTLRDLAAQYGRELPPGLKGERYEWSDFFDFLTQYGIVAGSLQTGDDYRRVATEICEDLAKQGVRYAEVTLSTVGQAMVTGDHHTPIASSLDGFEEGFERFGTRCTLILDHPRGFPIQYAEVLLEAALTFRDRGVVGLGLAGPEAQSGAPVAAVFEAAQAEGLHSVPHAGEAMGPESIREAIDLLGAERIGHGVRILEDDELVKEVAERRIPLEVCPTSNVALKFIDSIEDHPLPRLIDAGLVVTLNSDDPAMFETTVAREYQIAHEVFGFTADQLRELARNSFEASFLPAGEKLRMLDLCDRFDHRFDAGA